MVGALVRKQVNNRNQEVLAISDETIAEFAEDIVLDLPRKKTKLVIVGGKAITNDDLEWEFSLHTDGILNSEELTLIPELSTRRYQQELHPLKERLITSLIERKILHRFIDTETNFDVTSESRLKECQSIWQESLQSTSFFNQSSQDRERLKERLCERSIITQYLDEEVFPNIVIKRSEVEDYYRSNPNEFNLPERVLIKHVVLPSESDARRVRGRINRQNFAQIAKEVSISAEAESGGVLGPFARGEMPPVFEGAFSMRRGDISDVLKSTYGFHIILLEEKFGKEQLGLVDAAPKIREKILKLRREIAYEKLVDTALNTIEVKSPRPIW